MTAKSEKIQLVMAAMQLISTMLICVAAVHALIYMDNTTASREVWNTDRNFTIWLQCEVAEVLEIKLPEQNPCGHS